MEKMFENNDQIHVLSPKAAGADNPLSPTCFINLNHWHTVNYNRLLPLHDNFIYIDYKKRHGNAVLLHPPSKTCQGFKTHGCFIKISELVIIHHPNPQCN